MCHEYKTHGGKPVAYQVFTAVGWKLFMGGGARDDFYYRRRICPPLLEIHLIITCPTPFVTINMLRNLSS